MSKLSFNCRFKSPLLNSLNLPIEIRKSNLALAKQTLSSRPVDLEPGVYHVTARLPAGQELYSSVEIGDVDITVDLNPDPEDEGPNDQLEVQHFLVRQLAPTYPPGRLESMGAEAGEVKLRWFRGNILRSTPSIETDEPFVPEPGMPMRVLGESQTQLVQLLQPNALAWNFAVPTSPERGCNINFTRLPSGQWSLEFDLVDNMEADMLLRYSEQGYFQQAAIALTSEALKAEQLLREKVGDPIAAAVSAYTLLRFGDLERLHDWTDNLMKYFEWLPDGIAIRGEHLARVGKHAEALAVFLSLPSRGLPIFSDGLSYTVDRLGLYVDLGQSDFDREQLEQAQSVLKQLQQFAMFTDFRKSILTFGGTNPQQPNDEPISNDLTEYGVP